MACPAWWPPRGSRDTGCPACRDGPWPGCPYRHLVILPGSWAGVLEPLRPVFAPRRVRASAAAHGIPVVAEVGMLSPPVGRAWTRPGDGACRVGGCPRPWVNLENPLCGAHRDQQRALGEECMAEFVARSDVGALPSLGVCAVAACTRQLPTSGETYCATHLIRLRRARRGHRAGEVGDEARWRATESPVTRAGHAVLVALPVLVVVQVLFGVQQRAGEGVRTRDPPRPAPRPDTAPTAKTRSPDCGSCARPRPWACPWPRSPRCCTSATTRARRAATWPSCSTPTSEIS